MVVNRASRQQSGMSLLEMTIAIVIGAILMLSLQEMVGLGLKSTQTTHPVNELRYQANFSLERIAEQARTVPPRPLGVAATNTTGDWFAPASCSGSACVMYCLNTTSRQLIETTTSDTTCTGAGVLAHQVSGFSASLPLMGPLDRHSVIIQLSLDDLAGHSLTQTMQVRLGGGVQ
jgi:prepilin-type N-terminal cleavage/methylation domain-containing protein